MGNLDVALKCAHAGLHVFPVTPDKRKKPTVRGNWREYSTNDPATIGKWWSIRANHLVAIDLGKSDLLILDGDLHPNADGEVLALFPGAFALASNALQNKRPKAHPATTQPVPIHNKPNQNTALDATPSLEG
jgi:hypothetical protein